MSNLTTDCGKIGDKTSASDTLRYVRLHPRSVIDASECVYFLRIVVLSQSPLWIEKIVNDHLEIHESTSPLGFFAMLEVPYLHQ